MELCDLPFGYAPDHAPVPRGVTFTVPPGALVACGYGAMLSGGARPAGHRPDGCGRPADAPAR